MRRDVVIVGGGLIGASAAVALARRGLSVTLLDKQRGPSNDYFGYALWPPGTRVLRELGVFDELARSGAQLAALRWYDSLGAEAASLDLLRIAEPGGFLGILPSQVQVALDAACKSLGVENLRGISDWRLVAERGGGVCVSVLGPERKDLRAGIVLGCDGAESAVRRRLKLRALRWRPPRQLVLTGIGGALPVAEFHQTLGNGWSSGALSLGDTKSWLYGVSHGPPTGDPTAVVRARLRDDPMVGEAVDELHTVALFRPRSVRAWSWARDGVLLIGDAAHAMPPHLGLGGSLALEDVPVMADVVIDALARHDVSASRLREFQRRRSARIAYAQRASDLWALATTAALPGVGVVRDFNLRRMAANSRLLERFASELGCSDRRPRLRTRLGVMLP